MVLNYIWIGFFLSAFLWAMYRFIFEGDYLVFSEIINSTFSSADDGFRISLGLTGVLTLWMGLLKLGEKGGVVDILARWCSPFLEKLFPEVPKNHPVIGQMMLNFSANLLGLDNAATPIGLKTMETLQELNPKKDTATNAQIMFLVLNTSGLTILPIGVMVYRAQQGAAIPSDIFVPILLATFCSTLVGILVTSFYQKINLLQLPLLIFLGGTSLLVAGITYYFSSLNTQSLEKVSVFSGNFILFLVIVLFILKAMFAKINVYETFIEGAKEGFGTAIKIIPYLIAILVAIGVFRASGAMDALIFIIKFPFELIAINTDFVEALPTAIMKPLSGSGARGMMVDAMKTHGADSFVGRTASTIQGATDTTFYILAVYFGSVSIKNTRHAVTCGLIADVAGIIAAIFISYLFFH
jgi:spore maturation protein SpmA